MISLHVVIRYLWNNRAVCIRSSGGESIGRMEFMEAMQRLFIALILAAALLATPGAAFSVDQPRALCVQLKWLHQSQFAGLYFAKEAGLYSAAGLDVRFVQGGPQVDWQASMKDGPCDIGITNAYELVIARANGTPVTAVAALNQVSPIVFFSLKESGITDPRQFKNKSLSLVPTGKIHFLGVMNRVGINPDDVDLVKFSINMTPLYTGKVDIWSGYHTNLVTKAQAEGHKVNVIHPIDYGIQIYDDVIYVRDSLIEKNPGTVSAFLMATLKGWEKAFMDLELAVVHTLKYARDNDDLHELNLLLRTMPYIHTGEVPIGWMERSVWDEICALTLKTGLIEESPPCEAVFTDRFLKEVYR